MKAITFYSYKGGVGRTQALANIGYWLARRGRRTLMVDFDLEAPGLSYMCLPAPADESDRIYLSQLSAEARTEEIANLGAQISQRRGLVDLMFDEFSRGDPSPLFGVGTHERPLRRYYYKVRVPPSSRSSGSDGNLFLLPAGRMDSSYGARLQAIGLREFYHQNFVAETVRDVDDDTKLDDPAMQIVEPAETFRALKSAFAEFDYVLIDSRTGHSEESGICTQVLADILVLVASLNDQNENGMVDQLQRLASGTSAPLDGLILLLGPTPLGYDEEVETRAAAFVSRVNRVPRTKVDFSPLIPYHPRLGVQEWVFVATNPKIEISLRYGEVAARLVERTEGSPLEQVAATLSLVDSGDEASALRAATALYQLDPDHLTLLLERAVLGTAGDAARAAHRAQFLELLRQKFDAIPGSLGRLAEAYEVSGQWARASQALLELRNGSRDGTVEWCDMTLRIMENWSRAGEPRSAARVGKSAFEVLKRFENTDEVYEARPSQVAELHLRAARAAYEIGDLSDAAALLRPLVPELSNAIRLASSSVTSTANAIAPSLDSLADSVVRQERVALLLGDIELAAGRRRTAQSFFEFARAKARDRRDDGSQLRCLTRVLYAHFEAGRGVQARSMAERALDSAVSDQGAHLEARLRCLYAQILTEACELSEATEQLATARNLLRTEGSRRYEDQILRIEAQLGRARGERSRAARLAEESRRIAGEAGRMLRVAVASLVLGQIEIDNSLLSEAAMYFDSARADFIRGASELKASFAGALRILADDASGASRERSGLHIERLLTELEPEPEYYDVLAYCGLFAHLQTQVRVQDLPARLENASANIVEISRQWGVMRRVEVAGGVGLGLMALGAPASTALQNATAQLEQVRQGNTLIVAALRSLESP
jgi:MinD-like ATPase involved in chromosome partitioning or flagellar assembly